MSEKYYFYPRWIRVWHLVNAILCLLLIVSGISLQYSDVDSYVIGFQKAIAIHNFCGVALTLNYTLFIAGNIIRGNGTHYRLVLKGLGKRLWKQLYYYAYGVFKGEPAPYPVGKARKFNPLQQISYVIIMYVALPLIFITGWALLFPEFILKRFLGFSGVFLSAQLHMAMGFLVSVFLIIHVYVSTMGRTVGSNFRSMITGWQEAH
jgi:thiosulfate reductase cytochrome b subunit